MQKEGIWHKNMHFNTLTQNDRDNLKCKMNISHPLTS